MIAMIKEAGIFLVIAQAVLALVPGENYEKYVKVIVGLIMIAKLVQPVLSLLAGDAGEDSLKEFLHQSADLYEMSLQKAEKWETEDGEKAVLDEIGKELKEKLNEKSPEGYLVEDVEVEEEKEGEEVFLILTVRRTKNSENRKIQVEKISVEGERDKDPCSAEEEAIREYYGQILEMQPRQIEIHIK